MRRPVATPGTRAQEPLDHPELEEDDPIERMARDGFAALERFGAEIEAIFVPPRERSRGGRGAYQRRGRDVDPRTEPRRSRYARNRP